MSLSRNAVHLFLMALVRYSSAIPRSVPSEVGWSSSISRMMCRRWLRPFFGGMNFSTLSLKNRAPTLSLLSIALKLSTAAISASRSRLVCTAVPKSPERLTSTRSTTVSSLSSSNTFTYGERRRAVTFQSMERTSSPQWYSRTSLNAMPRPLNAEWYSPAKIWWDRALVRISILRTLRRRSVAD